MFALKLLFKRTFNVFTVLALLVTAPSKLFAQESPVQGIMPSDEVLYEDINGASEDSYDKSKCPEPPEFDIEKYKMGLVLRVKTGKLIDGIVKSERSAGRSPKVFFIARAGQDLKGAMVLKDVDHDGRVMTVADIIEGALGFRTNPFPRGTGAKQNEIHFDQKAISDKYADPTRKLVYSHLGLMIVQDPFINTRKHLTKAEKSAIAKQNEILRKKGIEVLDELPNNAGQYWVRELLKPCEGMRQFSWRTGLAGFFQDDPHEYKSVVMVPDQRIQDAIYSFLIDPRVESGANYKKFLAENYNVAANFKDPVDQNSNQFMLEVVAGAMMMRDQKINFNSTKRSDYLTYLEKTGFRPTKILPNSFLLKQATSPIAGWFMETLNIKDKDHPFARPYGITEIVTELSIREYLLRQDVIRPEGVHHITINEDDIKNVTITEKGVQHSKE